MTEASADSKNVDPHLFQQASDPRPRLRQSLPIATPMTHSKRQMPVRNRLPANPKRGHWAVNPLMMLCCLSWICCGSQAQPPLVVAGVHFDSMGRAVILAPSAAGSYSILYRGEALNAIDTPATLEGEPLPDDSRPVELTDPEWPLQNDIRFYRIEQVPVTTPKDLDADGLDDIYELTRQPGLDPFDLSDAELDPDGDRRTTLDEYRAGTDPFTHDAPITGQDPYPMPTTGTPFDPAPTDPKKSLVQKLLVYGADTDGNAIPLKTITIKNNTPFTVYPILRDGNEAETTENSGVGLYDPYDPVGTEYRGYVGYQGTDNRYYFGLQRGQTITLRVPLVFWNGARMGIVTDGRYLTPAAGNPNPLHYDPNSQRVIVTAEPANPGDHTPPNPRTHGVILWYRSQLVAPALDSPDQLLEWTIRDQKYLSNPQINARTKNLIPSSEKVTLINYDVSYVDNMFLPVAMEALDVPVPAPPTPFNQNRGPYGWIGSTNTPEDLQTRIKAFTAPNNALLGTYFGTNGWPTYNIPPDPIGEVKIPAGQNIFAQSPLAGALSSYDVLNNHFMLSSGGAAPIRVNIGGQGTASTGRILTLSPNEDVNKVRQLQPGFTVQGYAPQGKANPISPGTRISKITHISTGSGDPSTLELDRDLVASQEGCNFDFVRPVTDYAADAMIKLWYSWAAYYLNQTRDTPTQVLRGAVAVNTATLTFGAPVNGLVEGMQVTGAGLDSPDPHTEKGGVIVLAIAADKKSVILSQLARENHPLAANEMYTFTRPQPLPVTPASLFALDFSKDPAEPSRNPLEFSKRVYQVMASMAQIPKNPDPRVKTPHVLELMNNVIGGNMGFIFDTNAQRFSTDGLAISARIRDMIKSILRGVTDFTRFPEFDGSNHQTWYPDPGVPRSGLTFNAFNLDPFVWFVHVKLGFSGYGFSLDDDTADVGAGEATRLQLTIGGVAGLTNAHEWTIQAVYGPVSGAGNWDSSKTVSFFDAITDATDATPIVITSAKHDLANGDRVIIDQVRGNAAANGTWTVANATANTFELLNSTGNGGYTGGGRWSRGPLPYISGVDSLNVYWKLKGDDRQAGFTGALVAGPGVQQKGSVRIVQLGDDKLSVLALNAPLTNPDGTVLSNGTYRWTFSGK